MPPFLPRKRTSTSPPDTVSRKPVKRARLADALDAEATNKVPSLTKTKTFSLGSDSDSTLSDVDSDEFEDIPVDVKVNKAKKAAPVSHHDDEDDEDIEWEDAAIVETNTPPSDETAHVPMADGPIQLTFRKDDEGFDYSAAIAATGQKKGPTRREKQARLLAHQLHVQFLMFHNAIRNSWIGDKTVQQTLVKQLPSQITKEVEKWKRASGLVSSKPNQKPTPQKGKKRKKPKADGERSQRDWGQPSKLIEEGKPDMSHGDPLILLLKVLSAYWKKRFAITAPGLRKRGYGSKQGLKQDINSYRHEEHDPEKHGEKIQSLDEFRKIAEECEGSRDVGAQLFTALLRGLGIEARMVASLQPCGYGWTKAEQMLPRKVARANDESLDSESSDEEKPATKSKTPARSAAPKPNGKTHPPKAKKPKIISLDSDLDGEDDVDEPFKDDDSVIDVTPSTLKQKKAKYDRDMAFPIYWTEAVSPITNIILPVSPLVLETAVASNPESIAMFEPRGAKAEKARQVMAYVVAHSSDGSAKDVTVRYLRKRLWPGKTRGFRIPIEKVPIYNKSGKVKRYEDFDWFKRVMSPYGRSYERRTAVDDVEDASDLVPQEPEKKLDDGVDTLQSLKSSADYVLERFLRREEALRPEAKPVRTFISGKGDKYKEENVYRRADVERCLTAESWHKEGRRPKFGESAMKYVPVRAVTLTRKREAEEHERQTGEKQMQGLYSWDQTEYIIPDPIVDGIIPKNAYGNMDCFVPTMVPEGAVHIPLKGTMRICKKLEIDFAEAVTGFEFGNKRAVPVCTGVVIAKENEKAVRDAWEIWNEEQRRKEETKMEALVLGLWRKFVMGLRIRERIADVYGDELGVDSAATGLRKDDPIMLDEDHNEADQESGGGFLNDEVDEDMGGGFLMPHEDDVSEAEELVMDNHVGAVKTNGHLSSTEYSATSSFPAKDPIEKDTKLLSARVQTSPEHSVNQSDQDISEDSADEPMDFTQPKKRQSRQSNTKKDLHMASGGVDSKARANPHLDVVSQDDDDEDGVNGLKNEVSDDEVVDKTDGHDEDSESEPEYTPRSTRTRKAIDQQKSSSLNKKSALKAQSTLKLRASENKDVSGPKEPTTQKQGTPAGSGRRGRPRKSQVNKTTTDTAKRPRRLIRKESTIVTSPYFKDDGDDSQ